MRRRIAAFALLVCAAAGASRAGAQEVLRARGLPPAAVADSFRTSFGVLAAGATPRGEVALVLDPGADRHLRHHGPRYGVREWVHPDTVRAWAEAVRPGADTVAFGTAALRFVLPSSRPEDQRIGYFEVWFCAGGGGRVNHQSFAPYLRMADVLRRAADAARPAGAAGPPDDAGDGAPWWEHAGACPAAPLGPAPLAEDPAAPPLVARFVVGADGRPEPATLAALPGTARTRVEALRRVLREWSFRPALRGGAPVRQVVFLQVSPRASAREPPPRGRSPYGVAAGADGLVEVRWGERHEYAGVQPSFFTPDEVEAWVEAVRGERFPVLLGGAPAGLTPARRTTVSADTMSLGGRLRFRVHVGGCGWTPSGASDTTLVRRLARASAEARGRPLRPDPRAVYGPDQVDCLAVPDSANPAPRAAVAETAELHAAFVVDAEGRVERGSLRAMPGSDPVLVRALGAVLPRWRYLPATRLGRPVRQLVVVPVVFGRDGTGIIDPRRP